MDQNLKKQVCFKENLKRKKNSSVILIQTLLWLGCVDFELGLLFDMHVCFFTRPNMVLFILCFIVTAYVLPSVLALPLTPPPAHPSAPKLSSFTGLFLPERCFVLGMNLHILVKLHTS